jgi:hypothetical protein
MNLSERQAAFTLALGKLIIHADDLGLRVKIQEVNRTIEEQRQNMAAGVSKTMDSRHLDKLAADLYILLPSGEAVLDLPDAYRPLGQFWESLGGRWGGRFGLEDKPELWATRIGWDPYHFEFRKA